MLSLRHSIGIRPPLETLIRGSKSVPDSRCYASPPPTEICARPALYKTSDPIAEIRYTANSSQTGKEIPMLRRRVVQSRLWLPLLLGGFLTLSPKNLHAAEQPNPPEGLATPSPSTSMPVF